MKSERLNTSNIIFILSPTLTGSGAQRIAVDIATILSETYNIFLTIVMQTSEEYETPVQKLYLTKPSDKKLIVYLQIPLIIIRYLQTLRKYRPNIVHSTLYMDNILNMCCSPLFHAQPLISIHDISSYLAKSNVFIKLLIHLEIFLLKHTNTEAVAVSVAAKKDLIENYGVNPKSIQVIYNSINLKNIQDLSHANIPEGIILKDIPTIITVGRLHSVKAQWHLIRSFAVLRHERPARLLICGKGNEEAYLKSLAKDLRIADDVIFLGWQENPYKYMARSTAFILTSLSESFGIVLVEAMASGCPVIVANCSHSVCEIIGDNNEYGLLAKPMTGIRHNFDEALDSSEESLLEYMRKIIDDVKLRETYIENGKKRADFFSINRKIKDYELFIQKVMRSNT